MSGCLFAILAASAVASCGGADVSSEWENAAMQYSPPVLANGDLCGLFDFRNSMAQDMPSYAFIKCTGGTYRPSIYREGRRTDNLKLACLGRIEERVSAGGVSNAKPVRWGQSLDVHDAISVVANSYAGGTEISSEAFVLADAPVIAVRKSFTGTPPEEYEFEYIFRRPDSYDEKPLHSEYTARDGVLSFTVEKAVGSIHGRAALLCDTVDAAVESTLRGLRVRLRRPAGNIAFFLAFADDFAGDDPEAAITVLAGRIRREGWDGLKRNHVGKWRDWHVRSSVSIPDKKLQRIYDTSLYNLKCWSTRWSIPVGILPSHWNGTFFGFTFFGPALCATGHEDDMRKVALFWNSLLPAARVRAGRAYPGDASTGIRFAWLSDEKGAETSGNGRWRDHILHMGTVCHEAMTCWRYREDHVFLRETIYPVLKGSAEFYDHQTVYETKDGKTIIGKCCDLERMPSPVQNPFLTTCAAICALENAAEAAGILDVDGALAARWRELAARLRRDLPQDGTKYIPYPGYDARSVAVLGGLVPYGVIDSADPLQRAAVRDFDGNMEEAGGMLLNVKRVCTWYAAWTAAAQARLGDGAGAWRNLQKAASTCGRFGEIFEFNDPGAMSIPWCSSPQGTFVQAVNEMLLRCVGDELRLAPAVPAEWKDFSFRLRAYDDLTVEAEWKGGRCVRHRVVPGKAYSGRTKTLVFPDGRRIQYDAEAISEPRNARITRKPPKP
jgi:hypothetical protein